MSKLIIGGNNGNSIRKDITIRLLDTKHYNSYPLQTDGLWGYESFNGIPQAINMNIVDEMVSQLGAHYNHIKNIDTDIKIYNVKQRDATSYDKQYHGLFFFTTGGGLDSYSYPETHNDVLGAPTLGDVDIRNNLEEYEMDFDPRTDSEYVRNIKPYPVPFTRNGSVSNKILSVYIQGNFHNENEYRQSDFSTPLLYEIYNPTDGALLIEGHIYIDARKYDVEYDLTPYQFDTKKYTSTTDLAKVYYGNYAARNKGYNNDNILIHSMGVYSNSQTFDYLCPLLYNGYIYALQQGKEDKPKQAYCAKGYDWSLGIIANYKGDSGFDTSLNRPSSFTVQEYWIDYIYYDESGNFVSGNRLRPDTNIVQIINANGQITSSYQLPYDYLRLFDKNGNHIQLPNRMKFENNDAMDLLLLPKASYFSIIPRTGTLHIKFYVKGYASRNKFNTQEKILDSHTIVYPTKPDGQMSGHFRATTDKHFTFMPTITKGMVSIATFDSNQTIGIALQYASGGLAMKSYHGDFSHRCIIHIPSFNLIPSTSFVYAKNWGRRYSQFGKTLLH